MPKVPQKHLEHPVQQRLRNPPHVVPPALPVPEEPSVWEQIKGKCHEFVLEFRKGQVGWGTSFVFHAALLLCLYGVIISLKPRPEALSIDTVMAEDAGEQPFDSLLDESTLNPAEIEMPQALSILPEQDLTIQESDILPPSPTADLASATSNSQGQNKTGGKIGFFGASATGDSFVFIVDSSGSMTGARFERAKRELRQSIGRLDANQKFLVIFFNSETIPMYEPGPRSGLVTATQEQKQRVGRWIRHQQPISTTNPEGAIRMALSLKPAVIFLLSDGEFDEPELARQAAWEENRSSTIIHTIAFMSRDGELTLQDIAAQHGGTYRFVD